jgi:N utilization substance protein B
MTLSPQKFREIVLQILYSREMEQKETSTLVTLLMDELKVSKKNVSLAHERALKIEAATDEIDPLISSTSTSYNFDRIHKVTLSILRLALYELFIEKQIPPKVAIAEAIRLSRKFNSPESATFVNALLDHLYRASLGEVTNEKELQNEIIELLNNEEKILELSKEKIENAAEGEV